MKLTIVTPSYNQAQYITRTIESVISQKGRFEIEYIIMDGGSNDGTVEILKKYEEILKDKKYSHIHYYWKSEQDNGQSDAINKGLKLATGDILTYLNSDDTYEPGCFTSIVTTFSKENIERCYGKCKIINEYDQEIRTLFTGYKNLRLQSGRSYSKLLTENYISQMTTFWTKTAFEKIGYFNEDEHLCMDYEYWLRLGKVYKPKYIAHYLANFRFYHTSKSGERFKQQFTDQYRLAKKHAAGGHPFSVFCHSIFYWRTLWIYKLLKTLKI